MATPRTLKSTGTSYGGSLSRIFKPKGKVATLRKAKHITTPKRSDLPQEAESMTDFRFPHKVRRHTRVKGKGTAADKVFSPTSTSSGSYGDIFYGDFLTNLTDFYFTESNKQDFAPDAEDSDIGLLPRQLSETFAHGEDSPLRQYQDTIEASTTGQGGLEDIQRSITDTRDEIGVEGGTTGVYGNITTEEQNIEEAKRLYDKTEEQLTKQRAGQTMSGVQAEKQAQAGVARSGYEIGPSDATLKDIEGLSEQQLEALYEQKEEAQIGRQSAIDTSEINIEGYQADIVGLEGDITDLEDEGRRTYSDMQTAQEDYAGALGPFGSFANLGRGTVEAAEEALKTVDEATKGMFASAASRAKKSSSWGFKKNQTWPYKHGDFKKKSRFGGPKFGEDMYEVRDRLQNLSSFLPTAEEIAPIEDYTSQYDWLLED